jgi:hypothetical protein
VSTILKALRRLEEDKTAPVGRRPLREEVVHTAYSPRPRRGAWALALGALAGGVAVGVALLTVWPRGLAQEPSQQRVVRAPARAPEAAPAEPEVAPHELSAAALASPVEVVARPQAKPLVVDEPVPVAAAEPELSTERGGFAASVSAPAVASPPPAVAAAAAAREAPSTSPALPSTSPEDAAWRESEANAGRAAESAPPMARGIRVEQTFWHPRPDRRVAVLALPGREQPLRVHEGDAVGALVVSEIEPSGVVFTRQGQRVRRALGEAP